MRVKAKNTLAPVLRLLNDEQWLRNTRPLWRGGGEGGGERIWPKDKQMPVVCLRGRRDNVEGEKRRKNRRENFF
jgi:hypothetical protein